jgi:signal transduction histidine kinase
LPDPPPLLEKAEVPTIFEETLQLLRPQVEKQRISVQKNFRSLPPITIDKEQMKQVVLNLLLNAIQAMPKGGRLKLSGKIPTGNQWIQLSIRDTGIGIPPEDMDKLLTLLLTRRGHWPWPLDCPPDY